MFIIFIVKNLRIQVHSAAFVSGIYGTMLEVESGEIGGDSALGRMSLHL